MSWPRSHAAAITVLWARVAVAASVHVDVTPSHIVNQVNPLRSLGAGVDAVTAGAVDGIYTPANIAQMLSAGWGPVSYRLYTELSVQQWHWNPAGRWSAGSEGYWTGASVSGGRIAHSFGYRLPHRGFTHDQGNDDDFSRLDDGDPTTYWKSNPYLTAAFTGESDRNHPQWAIVNLGSPQLVDAVRIVWGAPYATQYLVQYWTGGDAIGDPTNGQWQTFPGGTVTNGTGGSVTLTLAAAPVVTQFVRVVMTASSNTCDTHGATDARNCVGYAIAELGVGTVGAQGFADLVRHTPDGTRQTATYVSSVDPWHGPGNQVTDEEQPGLDLVFTSGLTRGLPATVPVAMAYGTPDDAAAEITYLEGRGYPLARVELGEEADEQLMSPEDYGALYLQWATALHAADSTLALGGPASAVEDPAFWPDAAGNTSWLSRFLAYLRTHGRLADLAFVSVEHYPFAPCHLAWNALLTEPATISGLVQSWAAEGLPPGIPVFVTEYNVSFDYTEREPALFGALWTADFLGSLLSAGGAGAFFYEYEGLPLGRSGSCNSWGTFSMFTADDAYHLQAKTSEFFATTLVTQEWAQPVDAVHQLYSATSDVTGRGGLLVTAYALHRPDGQWALLLVNKDAGRAHPVGVIFHDSDDASDHSFAGPVTQVSIGGAAYRWHPRGPAGFPRPDGPLTTSSLPGGPGVVYVLPKASVTVLRGSIS